MVEIPKGLGAIGQAFQTGAEKVGKGVSDLASRCEKFVEQSGIQNAFQTVVSQTKKMWADAFQAPTQELRGFELKPPPRVQILNAFVKAGSSVLSDLKKAPTALAKDLKAAHKLALEALSNLNDQFKKKEPPPASGPPSSNNLNDTDPVREFFSDSKPKTLPDLLNANKAVVDRFEKFAKDQESAETIEGYRALESLEQQLSSAGTSNENLATALEDFRNDYLPEKKEGAVSFESSGGINIGNAPQHREKIGGLVEDLRAKKELSDELKSSIETEIKDIQQGLRETSADIIMNFRNQSKSS